MENDLPLKPERSATDRGRRPRPRVQEIALQALAAALLSALGNTLVVLVQLHVVRRPLGATPDFALLSPVAYLVIFALVAVPVFTIVRFTPPRWAVSIGPAAFVTLAAFALLSQVPRIHPLAILAVATGLGVRAGVGWARRPHEASKMCRHVARLSGGLLAVLALSTVVVRWANGRRLASDRGVADAGAPNVLLLIFDTVRARNLHVYGNPRPNTPVLQTLVAEGVTFDHAFSTASWSAPSHASMVTGLYASQTGADYRSQMRRDVQTLPEALNARGYLTAGFVGNFVYAGRNAGIARGFSHFEDFQRTPLQVALSSTLTQSRSGRMLVQGLATRKLWRVLNAFKVFDLRFETYSEDARSTPDIIDGFWRWRGSVGTRPWFAMLNFMDAHGPYQPPAPYRTMFGDGSRDIDRYDGAIAYLDHLFGTIVRELDRRGDRAKTIVIVTSDHGELFGEHGIEGHVGSIYRRAMHVPLILSGGSVPRGVRIDAEVSLRDLAATILDLTDARGHQLPGHSLRSAWSMGFNTGSSPVVIETTRGINVEPPNRTIAGPIRGAVDSTRYFIRYGDGNEELFAWRFDPDERVNLAPTDAGRLDAERLRRLIERELAPRPVGRERTTR